MITSTFSVKPPSESQVALLKLLQYKLDQKAMPKPSLNSMSWTQYNNYSYTINDRLGNQLWKMSHNKSDELKSQIYYILQTKKIPNNCQLDSGVVSELISKLKNKI